MEKGQSGLIPSAIYTEFKASPGYLIPCFEKGGGVEIKGIVLKKNIVCEEIKLRET